jgi:septal ring factor EnvC (AmiA/AmiB activator)
MKAKEILDKNATAARLVDDLNAVRSVVLNKQRDITSEDYANLERRLFESWVIEKLAEFQTQFAAAAEERDQAREQLDLVRKELDEELKLLRKELKEVQKLSAKLAKKVFK